jgi:hypothetical protein
MRRVVRYLARLCSSPRGIEVRCPCHGHLLGILIKPGILEMKCRGSSLVRVETKGGHLSR